MIARLCGTVIEISRQDVIVDVSGVGYQLYCTDLLVNQLVPDSPATILVYTDVQERAINLYGFYDQTEKHVFLLLISVSGIGPKSAAEILSKVDRLDLLKMLASQDTTGLRKVKGVGAKKAERLIVELKDKVKNLIGEGPSQRSTVDNADPATHEAGMPVVVSEALQALRALGFGDKNARKALEISLQSNDQEFTDPGDLVRVALTNI